MNKIIKGVDVLRVLCPDGGWVISESDFDNIIWTDDRPRCTKEAFEKKLIELQEKAAEEEMNRQIARNALLEKLGITEEEAKLLLS